MNDDKPTATEADVLESLQTVPTDPTGRIDLEQLAHRLSLTPAERLAENDRFAAFLSVIRSGRRVADGRDA